MLKPVFEDVRDFNCSDLYLKSVSAPSGAKIWGACHEIAHLLIEKNISYGDSALNPARIFSSADATEQLKVRMIKTSSQQYLSDQHQTQAKGAVR